MAGFNFRYQTPGVAGDAVRAIAGIAQGRQAEIDKQREEAMKQALFALKQSEVAETGRHNKAAEGIDLNTGLETSRHNKATEANTTATGIETGRHNLAEETHWTRADAADMVRARAMGQSPGKLGWRLVQIDGVWNWVPPPQGLGGTGGGGAAPGEGTQPDAQTVIGPNGKPAHGSQGIPNAAEQQNNMLVTSIEPSLGRIEAAYGPGGKGMHAPSIMSQGLADMAKKGGFLGGAANTALGGQGMIGKLAKMLGGADPEYQNVLTDLTKVYRAYVYVTTGKQLNESEAADNVQQYVPRAGEPDALVQKKVTDIQNMASSVRQASKRARDFVARQQAGSDTATPAPTGVDALKKKYNLE